MMHWIFYLLIPFLALIVVQDFKYFSIQLILLIGFNLVSLCISIFNSQPLELAYRFLLNFSILIAEFFAILIYISLRKNRITLKDSIGLGDLLFILGPSFLLNAVDFVHYQLAGFSFALGYQLFVQYGLKLKENRIPLAGIMALLLFPFLYLTKI